MRAPEKKGELTPTATRYYRVCSLASYPVVVFQVLLPGSLSPQRARGGLSLILVAGLGG